MASWQNESYLTEMTVLSTVPASTGMIVLFRTVLVVQARNKYMMLAYSSQKTIDFGCQFIQSFLSNHWHIHIDD